MDDNVLGNVVLAIAASAIVGVVSGVGKITYSEKSGTVDCIDDTVNSFVQKTHINSAFAEHYQNVFSKFIAQQLADPVNFTSLNKDSIKKQLKSDNIRRYRNLTIASQKTVNDLSGWDFPKDECGEYVNDRRYIPLSTLVRNVTSSFDVNKDGKLTQFDALSYKLSQPAKPENVRVFLDGLLVNEDEGKLSSGEAKIAYTTPQNLIPISKAVIDELAKTTKIPTNIALTYMTSWLDPNTDGSISKGDDFNFDGVISPGDFHAIRTFREFLEGRYAKDFSKKKVARMDVLAFWNDYFSENNPKMKFFDSFKQYSPLGNNFTPQQSRNQTRFNTNIVAAEKYIQGSKTSKKTLGGLLGIGVPFIGALGVAGGMASTNETTTHEYGLDKVVKSVRYELVGNEQEGNVLTAAFQVSVQGDLYTVLFFDSSQVVTDKYMLAHTERYLGDKKLFETPKSREKISNSVTYSQKTAGRVLVINPSRKIRTIYTEKPDNNLVFGGIFYSADMGRKQDMLQKEPRHLTDPFREAISIVQNETNQIRKIAKGYAVFDPKRTFVMQDAYLGLNTPKKMLTNR